MADVEQGLLFDIVDPLMAEWRGMPEFKQEDLTPWKSVMVHFATPGDMALFAEAIGQTMTDRTRSVWYPEAEIGRYANKRYLRDPASPAAREDVNPRYPVYIISKGRWETRLTSKALEAMGVPYHIVVEPQERDQYAAVIDPAKILVLPFSNLGLGGIPARNWVWEHAKASGARRHWIMDDNIEGFYRLNYNLKTPAADGLVFRAAEDFVDRYQNVPMAGLNYFMFASRKTVMPPFYLNTRVYSCILLDNGATERWRGRYNEDTDLSLRFLKAGFCTILFNAFLCGKSQTMTMKGGNSDELYKSDGRLQMAQSLVDQHPDVVRVSWKWGRYQHHVDYTPFRRNRLQPRPDLVLPAGSDDFGMILQERIGDDWKQVVPGTKAKAEVDRDDLIRDARLKALEKAKPASFDEAEEQEEAAEAVAEGRADVAEPGTAPEPDLFVKAPDHVCDGIAGCEVCGATVEERGEDVPTIPPPPDPGFGPEFLEEVEQFVDRGPDPLPAETAECRMFERAGVRVGTVLVQRNEFTKDPEEDDDAPWEG